MQYVYQYQIFNTKVLFLKNQFAFYAQQNNIDF
jgi:hypothetical protein